MQAQYVHPALLLEGELVITNKSPHDRFFKHPNAPLGTLRTKKPVAPAFTTNVNRRHSRALASLPSILRPPLLSAAQLHATINDWKPAEFALGLASPDAAVVQSALASTLRAIADTRASAAIFDRVLAYDSTLPIQSKIMRALLTLASSHPSATLRELVLHLLETMSATALPVVHAIVEAGGVATLINIAGAVTSHTNITIVYQERELALIALANLSAAPSCRSLILYADIFPPLLAILSSTQTGLIELRPSALRVLAMLFKPGQSLVSEVPPSLLPVLSALFHSAYDSSLLASLLWVWHGLTSSQLSYHFPLSPQQQQSHSERVRLCDTNTLKHCVTLSGHSQHSVRIAALALLANLVMSDTGIVDLLLSCGLIPSLVQAHSIVSSCAPSLDSISEHQQINFIVSCVCASSHQHCIALIEGSSLIESMIDDVSNNIFEISVEAMWAIANASHGPWNVARRGVDGSIPDLPGMILASQSLIEAVQRRKLLATRPGLMSALCSLLSMTYENDPDHLELIEVTLVTVGNLLSSEWWLKKILESDQSATGIERALLVRHNNTVAMGLAKHVCPGVTILHSHNYLNKLEYYPRSSPLHPPETSPLTSAFLLCDGLELLGRFEMSSLPNVRDYTEHLVCLMFTEFCRDHDSHSEREWEDRDLARGQQRPPMSSACLMADEADTRSLSSLSDASPDR